MYLSDFGNLIKSKNLSLYLQLHYIKLQFVFYIDMVSNAV